MIDAPAEKAPVLTATCREVGDADCLITMLGDRELEAASFFVANTAIRPDLVKTGSSKFRETNNYPMEERKLSQRTLGRVVADRDQTFQLLKLDVQGAECASGLGLSPVGDRGDPDGKVPG